MDRYDQTFQNRHVILPAIHVQTTTQALRNTRIAQEAGCDGVFLINHLEPDDRRLPTAELLEIYQTVRQALPGFWLGVNCLELMPAETFERLPAGMAGVWVDNALIDEQQTAQPTAAEVLTEQQKYGWTGLYFGGVAFKYQTPVQDVALAARLAAPYMDVITTSGVATGQAADRAKIAAMKQALGDKPLALASGISPENVSHYLDIADCFLVATAISLSFSDLDPVRVKALVAAVRAYRPSTSNV